MEDLSKAARADWGAEKLCGRFLSTAALGNHSTAGSIRHSRTHFSPIALLSNSLKAREKGDLNKDCVYARATKHELDRARERAKQA